MRKARAKTRVGKQFLPVRGGAARAICEIFHKVRFARRNGPAQGFQRHLLVPKIFQKGRLLVRRMTAPMNSPATSRRRFLQTSLAGAVTLPAWAKPLGANGDVRVAVIGFRGRGGGHIKELLALPGVRVVALCDVDQQVIDKKVEVFAKQNLQVKTYRDFRECCADKDVDAVTIATPNHSHVLIALTA